MQYRNVYIDYGHGGLYKGKYANAGKQYTFTDRVPHIWVGEGILNRCIAAKVIEGLLERGVRVFDVVAAKEWTHAPAWTELEQSDVSLQDRVGYANEIHTLAPGIYVSIHANAIGSTIRGPSLKPRGISVFTSYGQTASDAMADQFYAAFRNTEGQDLPVRRGNWEDGDEDHEANFYVLRRTRCPAVLIEGGFFTNIEDATFLLSLKGQDAMARAYLNALTKAH